MRTREILNLLRQYESRNVTYMEADGSWPIAFARARGMHVWDAEGKKYLDLTAAFGVAAAGHANPKVVQAGQQQMPRLLHAMGDVHPHELKARLERELSRITFERWTQVMKGKKLTGKVIFCNSGFEAVEAALKTAMLATKREKIIAFKGAYHGLGYGALNATHRSLFRRPFRKQLVEFGEFLSFPRSERDFYRLEPQLISLLKTKRYGDILIEPFQARGGINIPPPGFLRLLRSLCDEYGACLILDEIYTGFGRTGQWFACEYDQCVPDLICLGKALTGGFPLSACVGRAEIMDRAWPVSGGEAIHTSTYLGHPVGCAMALAQIKEIEARNLPDKSSLLGAFFIANLEAMAREFDSMAMQSRGVGLMVGLEICTPDKKPATAICLEVIKRMLHRGFVLLPEGEHANVISFTPPLIIKRNEIQATVDALRKTLKTVVTAASRR